jgi:hypothetical protein
MMKIKGEVHVGFVKWSIMSFNDEDTSLIYNIEKMCSSRSLVLSRED